MSWKLKQRWTKPRIRPGSWWKKFVTELGIDEVASERISGLTDLSSEHPILLALLYFAFKLICFAKSLPMLNWEILWVNHLTSFYDFFFFFSWIEKSILTKLVISLLGNLFFHFLHKKALRLTNPQLTLASGPALREVKLETSRGPSSWTSRKHILYFQSLDFLFLFFFNAGFSVCICHCTKKLGSPLLTPVVSGELAILCPHSELQADCKPALCPCTWTHQKVSSPLAAWD